MCNFSVSAWFRGAVGLTTNPSREEAVENQGEADGADWILKGYLSAYTIVEEACIGRVPENAGSE
jgi:hypothetical protein